MSKLGPLSLASSLAGLLTLAGGLVTLARIGAPSGEPTVLDVVLTAADLAGLLLGLVAYRCPCGCRTGAAGLHPSWAPLAVAFLVLAAYRPVLAAEFVKRLAAGVGVLFDGLAEVLVTLAT